MEEQMQDIISKVQQDMRAAGALRPGDTVIAAVSGGADSVCMLHILKELSLRDSFRIVVCHVHHGIRGEEADRDAEFTDKLAGGLDLAFRRVDVDVPALARQGGLSLEEAGRLARYRCLQQVKEEEKADWIALAHHRDDQIETVLFHLLRGTGLRGLRGMLPVRGDRIRPLLGIGRTEIEEWLTERKLSWCTDSTNTDPEYARNRIRNRILPEMLLVNPGAGDHILRLAREAAERYEAVSARAETLEKDLVRYGRDEHPEGRIPAYVEISQDLRQGDFPREVTEELIFRQIALLAGSRKDITGKHIDAVYRLFEKETGKRTDLPYGLTAQRTYQGIKLTGRDRPSGPGELKVPEGHFRMTRMPYRPGEDLSAEDRRKKIDAARVRGHMVVRTMQAGDRITISDSGEKKKLGRLFTDARIPAELRQVWPVVADDEEVIWVVGLRLNARYKITEETKEIWLLEY